MGSGHNEVAAALGDRLTAAGHQVSRADVLDLLPAGLGRAIRSFYHATISHFPVLYAGIYQVFFRDGAEPRPGGTPLAGLAVGGRRAEIYAGLKHIGAEDDGALTALDHAGRAGHRSLFVAACACL